MKDFPTEGGETPKEPFLSVQHNILIMRTRQNQDSRTFWCCIGQQAGRFRFFPPHDIHMVNRCRRARSRVQIAQARNEPNSLWANVLYGLADHSLRQFI